MRVAGGLLALALWFTAGEVNAQEEGAPAGVPITTLRAFADLIQVPVVVVDDRFRPIKEVEAQRFLISLDSGPEFHPQRVRVEGDDPISLSVLVDVRGLSAAMLQRVADGVSELARNELHPGDHMTVYGLDCGTMRSLRDAERAAGLLRDSVGMVLREGPDGNMEKPRACSQKKALWDAISLVLAGMTEAKGRRVALVVSDGYDEGSKRSWAAVTTTAQAESIAVFGVTPFPDSNAIDVFRKSVGEPEARFRLLCDLSGGLVLHSDARSLSRRMGEAMEVVRARYILEFARPRQDTPGKHDFQVTVAKMQGLVHPSGVSVTLPDPAVMKDPLTIPRDTRDAPEMGKRKILKPSP